MDLSQDVANEILHVSFNQDNTCLAVGTETGFFVCDTNPLNLRFTRRTEQITDAGKFGKANEILIFGINSDNLPLCNSPCHLSETEFDEGIGIVEMLFRCNILALVGGGKRPKYPANCVMIWDDHQERKIAELEFRSPVKAVKMRRDRIVVALETKIYIYNFEDLRLIGQQDTANVNLGLIGLSPTSQTMVLAFPSPYTGEVCVVTSDGMADVRKNFQITESALAQLTVDPAGEKIAITSEKGTLIRILNVQGDADPVSYRRGSRQANIQCLSFSGDSAFLACTSDHGTVHFFQLGSTTGGSYWGKFTKTDEPRAVASFHVEETHSICAFVPNGSDDVGGTRKSLVVLGASGSYYLLELVKNGDSWVVTDTNQGQKKSFLPT